MSTRASHLSDQTRQRLAGFGDRVAELGRNPLIRSGELRSPDPVPLLIQSMVPDQAFHGEKETMPEYDPILLKDLARILRHFELEGDLTSIRRLVEALQNEPLNNQIKAKLKNIKRRFINLPNQMGGHSTIDGIKFDHNETTIWDIFIYGEIAHTKHEKRQQYNAIMKSRNRDTYFSIFVRTAMKRSSIIFELFGLLRDQGLVAPIPDVIAHVVGMVERSRSELSRMGCKWGNIMERLYLKRRNLR